MSDLHTHKKEIFSITMLRDQCVMVKRGECLLTRDSPSPVGYCQVNVRPIQADARCAQGVG